MNWERRTEGRNCRAWHECKWRGYTLLAMHNGQWLVWNRARDREVAGGKETGPHTAKRAAERFVLSLSDWAIEKTT